MENGEYKMAMEIESVKEQNRMMSLGSERCNAGIFRVVALQSLCLLC